MLDQYDKNPKDEKLKDKPGREVDSSGGGSENINGNINSVPSSNGSGSHLSEADDLFFCNG